MKKLLLLSVLLGVFVLTSNAQITGGSSSSTRTTPSQSKDYLFKNGLLIDGMLSTGSFSGIAGRIGNRWNFGTASSYRVGFQVIWGRIGIYGSDGYTFLTIAPLNVGVVGTIKMNNEMGIETAFNLGYNMVTNLDEVDAEAYGGILINPEVKFRYKVLAVGLDLAIMNGGGGASATIGISAGFRF